MTPIRIIELPIEDVRLLSLTGLNFLMVRFTHSQITRVLKSATKTVIGPKAMKQANLRSLRSGGDLEFGSNVKCIYIA